MATRKFGNIEYLIPGVDSAIENLRPGARWDNNGKDIIEWEDDEGREPPTWEEIEEEVLRQFEVWNYFEYERNRSLEFPDVIEQLDMLFHDIENNNLNNGNWINAIRAIKKNNPKPDFPRPNF